MSVLDIQSKQISVHGEPVTITNETIHKTCRWYADNALGCIDEMKFKGVFVNDPDQYTKDNLQDARDYLEGNFETGLWFWQRALSIQTGESVPMLSK